ncbi:hypothetical protein CK203_038051 [Vitis vinifera]|uniref:Integrase catalytic domain-containing protein n=2 Tax=Vitis vinifera TaxID=29760 RepID=A0A438HNR1_VITVI|nr:hypothetical protein CK203_038051 [Vitis vinifera]
MPMNPILIVDLFYVWGIDFMGPFPMVVLKFLKENIFSRFGVPKAIISDGGTHFCNKPFETLLAKYGVKHKVATPYHPQTSGQVELANREIKNILMKVVITSKKIVYGKACHLPVEVEYKAWWAIKRLNMDLIRAGAKRCLDLNEMEELRNDAYINSKVAKQRMKRWHDQLISNKEFGKDKESYSMTQGSISFLGSSSQDIFKSMVIVSSHSLSHSSKKMRKSTSLSHKKPDQRRPKVGRCEKFRSPRSRCENRFPAKPFRSPCALWKIFAAAKAPWHTSAISSQYTVSQLRNGCEFPRLEIHRFTAECHFEGCFVAAKPPFGTRVPLRSAYARFAAAKSMPNSLRNHAAAKSTPPRAKIPSAAKRNSVKRSQARAPSVCLLPEQAACISGVFADTAMARTRGAKSSSPSTRLRIPRDAPVQDSISEPPRPRLVSPPVKDAPTSPPARRYNTRRSLTMPVRALPEAKNQSPPPAKSLSHLNTSKRTQIPSGMTPEVAIRRPMVTQPQLRKSGLQSKAIPLRALFRYSHLRIQPKLRSPLLLQRYHMEHLLTPGIFSIPEWHWTSIVHDHKPGASSRHYILRKELSPSMFFIDALLAITFSTSALGAEERSVAGGIV